jgi:pheromone shutdown protein TraB
VERVIAAERPDCVCVELDARRYAALAQRTQFESLDLRAVIRNRQLAPLLVNLVLASYQRQLGGALGVLPGSELLAAARAAEAREIPVRLCDRDGASRCARTAALSLWRRRNSSRCCCMRCPGTSSVKTSCGRRQQDVLSRLMAEIGEAFPALKAVLIDGAMPIWQSSCAARPRIVAVVGAGRVAGMRAALASGAHDLNALESCRQRRWRCGWRAGASRRHRSVPAPHRTPTGSAAWRNALFWVLATGLPDCGVVARPPDDDAGDVRGRTVHRLEPAHRRGLRITSCGHTCGRRWCANQTVTDDVRVPRQWWQNLLRICLVFLLTTIGTSMGTLVGTAEILRRLF